MYLSYYKLNKKPFQISTDPSFFWLGEKLKEALSILKYGVMDDKGFLLLTGDVGTGKTTLINSFVNSLGDDVLISRVSDPGLTQLDFINYIAKMFKIETKFETKSEFIILFTQFLEQAHKNNKKVLLIIDEAQHLTDETLEEIRLLSNIENQDKKLLNIFLVGQSEFNETLEKYKNRALRQRLTLNFTLYPLEPEETKACIEYRLKVAGTVNQIFSPEAIDAIHTISNGFPRVINIICDHALRLGCQEDQEIISDTLIHRCSKTLHAAHLPQSYQYDGQLGSSENWLEESEVPPLSPFGSSDNWLEESEVPPLSPEAIDKASQPLPDFTIASDEEIKEKPGTSRIVVSLLIASLLISGFFLYKDGNLASISKVITSLIKNTIASTSTNQIPVNDSTKPQQQSIQFSPTETPTGANSVPSSPAVITTTQKKQTFKTTVSEEIIETVPSETTSKAIDPKPQPTTASDMVEVMSKTDIKEVTAIMSISSNHIDGVNNEILKQEPVVSELTMTPSVIVKDDQIENIVEDTKVESTQITQPQPSITETSTATESTNTIELETTQTPTEQDVISVDTATELSSTVETVISTGVLENKDQVSEILDVKATESPSMKDVLSDNTQEDKNVELEITTEPSKQTVGQTPTIAGNDINIMIKTTPQSEVESFPKNSSVTPNQSTITPEREKPEEPAKAPIPSKVPDKNDDPGAVIDWLLKSR